MEGTRVDPNTREEAWLDPDRARLLKAAGKHEELAREATAKLEAALARRGVRESSEIFWDDVAHLWIRRIGRDHFPDPDLFASPSPPFSRWASQSDKYRKDAEDYWFYVYKPQPGDTIVEIGAGRGEDTYAFSRVVGDTGHVWAIEPHPESFRVLEAFCRWNKLRNVSTFRYACVDSPAELQIETLPVWESNYVRTGGKTDSSDPVKGVTFDSLSKELGIGEIDFLKMNIEGAERLALRGCQDAIRRSAFVCICAHDFRANRGEGEQFRTLALVREHLRDAGFHLITRDDDPRYYVPYHVHGVRVPERRRNHAEFSPEG